MKKLFIKIFSFITLTSFLVTPIVRGEKTPSDLSKEFNILNKVSDNKRNVMISPFSIKSAFMLAANGTKDDTQKEILESFGVNNIEKSNSHFKDMITSYNQGNIVKVLNSVWLNRGWNTKSKFNENYTNKIGSYFNAQAKEVNSLNAVREINNWVKNGTKGKINKIIDNSNFLAILVNAVYFKGDWEKPFKKEKTQKDIFYNYDGGIKTVDFMNQKGRFNYFEDDDLQLVEMKYKNSNISMYVVLPKENKSVTPENIDNAINKKQISNVEIKLPKFKTETSLELQKIMKEIGIKKAFDPRNSDFKDIMFSNLSKNPYISSVIHKSYIEVDELGTEAAAVTAISIRTTSLSPPKIYKKFEANRPFTYIIRDNKNNETLFIGNQILFQ